MFSITYNERNASQNINKILSQTNENENWKQSILGGHMLMGMSPDSTFMKISQKCKNRASILTVNATS